MAEAISQVPRVLKPQNSLPAHPTCTPQAANHFIFPDRFKPRWPLTVRNLIWLPPLLIDEDDGDQNEDFCHDAQEGPERCQAAADAQVHRGIAGAVGVGAIAEIIACVLLNIQFKDA